MESGPQRKALEINLDPSEYGTFAEIGAGQEVADWFLRVGGASGTVAQTICAYDKAFSDERYGPGTRYVSRERLLAMLDHEYRTLEAQLREPRGHEVRFFAFADTVAARNFKGDNEQHGWVGLRFQAESGAPPSDVLLHVALRDHDVEQQRTALGVLGVNLVHAAFHQKAEARPFLAAVFEGLSLDRLEIDVVELAGPAFAGQDSRLWCLEALRLGLARALLFDAAGRPDQPSTVLRKRSLIVEGRTTGVEVDPRTLIATAFAQLDREARPEHQPMLLLDVRLEQLTGSRETGGPGDCLTGSLARPPHRDPSGGAPPRGGVSAAVHVRARPDGHQHRGLRGSPLRKLRDAAGGPPRVPGKAAGRGRAPLHLSGVRRRVPASASGGPARTGDGLDRGRERHAGRPPLRAATGPSASLSPRRGLARPARASLSARRLSQTRRGRPGWPGAHSSAPRSQRPSSAAAS